MYVPSVLSLASHTVWQYPPLSQVLCQTVGVWLRPPPMYWLLRPDRNKGGVCGKYGSFRSAITRDKLHRLTKTTAVFEITVIWATPCEAVVRSKFIFKVWYVSARIRYLYNQCRHNLTPRTQNLCCHDTYLNISPQNFHSSYLSQRKSNLISTSNLRVHRTVLDQTHEVTRRRNYCANDVVRRTWTAHRRLWFRRFRYQQHDSTTSTNSSDIRVVRIAELAMETDGVFCEVETGFYT